MRLIHFADGTYREMDLLLDALSLEARRSPVISVVGAGGKTSLIMALAEQYAEHRRKVIVTTTTHMLMPEQGLLLTDQTPQLQVSLRESGKQTVWLGIPTREHKIKNPSEEMWRAAFAQRVPVLIEADGAKRLPCKVPAEHEPVIRQETTMVIGVLGMDAVGERIEAVCHRPELAAQLLKTDLQHKMTWMDLVQIAVSEQGLRKSVTGKMRYIIIFQKTDAVRQIKTAGIMAKELQRRGYEEVYFGVKESK